MQCADWAEETRSQRARRIDSVSLRTSNTFITSYPIFILTPELTNLEGLDAQDFGCSVRAFGLPEA